jgi:transcriptional regulator with XRE-family HTH domain
VGDALGFHHSTISRWERGETMPDDADTAAVLAIYGVRGPDRDRLVELARLNSVADWVAPHGGEQLAALMEYERRAQRIIHVNLSLVPGLLQTRDYARSLMIGNRLPLDEVERLTAVRIGRQKVLNGRRPVTLVAVLGEQALRYPPCTDAVMIEQLHHLLAMSERPNIGIRLLPLELRRYTPALEGQFVLLELQRDKPVVQAAGCRSVSMLTNPRTVARYQETVDVILADSLDASASAQRLAEIAKDLEANYERDPLA